MDQKQDFFTVLNGRVIFRRGKYNLTSDAVWLAASVAAPKTTHPTVLDVGVGTGGAALCLMARLNGVRMTGIDISDAMLAECTGNVALNNHNIDLIHADILAWKTDRTFDIVMTNPPYFRGRARRTHPAAHHNADLTAWTAACIRRVRPRGYFYCIVDAAAATEIIAALHSGNMGDVTIIPLIAKGIYAERVLINARLGSRGGARVRKSLTMNDDRILREMKDLSNL